MSAIQRTDSASALQTSSLELSPRDAAALQRPLDGMASRALLPAVTGLRGATDLTSGLVRSTANGGAQLARATGSMGISTANNLAITSLGVTGMVVQAGADVIAALNDLLQAQIEVAATFTSDATEGLHTLNHGAADAIAASGEVTGDLVVAVGNGASTDLQAVGQLVDAGIDAAGELAEVGANIAGQVVRSGVNAVDELVHA